MKPPRNAQRRHNRRVRAKAMVAARAATVAEKKQHESDKALFFERIDYIQGRRKDIPR